MITLVAVIEHFEVCGELNFMGRVAASWRYTGRVVKRMAPRCKILYFSESMIKFGVLPRVIAHQTETRSVS